MNDMPHTTQAKPAAAAPKTHTLTITCTVPTTGDLREHTRLMAEGEEAAKALEAFASKHGGTVEVKIGRPRGPKGA